MCLNGGRKSDEKYIFFRRKLYKTGKLHFRMKNKRVLFSKKRASNSKIIIILFILALLLSAFSMALPYLLDSSNFSSEDLGNIEDDSSGKIQLVILETEANKNGG